MANQLHRIGGFAAFNTGRIENCFSCVSLRTGEAVGGFCGENRGTIRSCISRGSIKRRGSDRASGFCARQNGTADGCFWVCGRQEKQDCWTDWSCAVPENELDARSDALLAGWDTEHIWHISHSSQGVPVFQLYDRSDSPAPRRDVVEIGSKDEFLRAVRTINSGASVKDTLYRLTADLDLGGKPFSPIGPDPHSSFSGCFDGCGHTIRNLRIRANSNTYAALFGCVGKGGEVHNLVVDGMIEGRGDHAAGLCALNEGLISNCVVRVCASESRYAGGLAAENSGVITRCSTYGQIRPALPFPWWLPAALLGLLLCSLPLVFSFMSNRTPANEVFAPVIMDPNAQVLQPDDPTVPEPEPEDMTDSSASFVMNAAMSVSRENYAGSIGLRCPPWSKRGFVATATVSAADLKKNGASYQNSAVVYQSGLITPNMGVNVITLGKLPDGSALPAGTYELTVSFDFYDIETNERAAVNSTAPLDVTIH